MVKDCCITLVIQLANNGITVQDLSEMLGMSGLNSSGKKARGHQKRAGDRPQQVPLRIM
jgi:hypothetical protein